MFKIILLSLVATTIFGLIDGGLFFFVEEGLTKQLKKIKFLDSISIPLVVGMLSASIAVYASTFIRVSIKKKIEILEYPIIAMLGIIIGNIIIIGLYSIFRNSVFFKDFRKKHREKHIENK